MEMIEINSYVPQIARAPHKLYVLEMSYEELAVFKVDAQTILRLFEPFADVDERTNMHIVGLDGDKGPYKHRENGVTHGVVMDFRPLAIHVVFWQKPDKPDLDKVLALEIPTERRKVTRRDD